MTQKLPSANRMKRKSELADRDLKCSFYEINDAQMIPVDERK